MVETFEQRVRKLIKRIPKGKVATYGLIATMAGNPRGARQVVRVLSSCSNKDKLPWHRVINREGKISMPVGNGYEEQHALLEREGVIFGLGDRVNLDRFLWTPRRRKPARSGRSGAPRS
jgi:methylated-DNA-protein-cysteine methyltransferase related protein